jgi:aldose 1-epimerase
MATIEHIPEGQLEAVVLADGDLRAAFVPGAGMIGCSLRHRGDELLVQRGGLDSWRGTGRTFGLPLLHPWANRLRDWRYAAAGRSVTIDRALGVVRADANGLPIHGALGAAADWDVTDAGADAGGARLAATLDYAHRHDRFAAFPFPHRLELAFRLAGDTLEVVTTLVPTGDEPVPVAFGWHPWLSLPGVERAAWELDLPARARFALDDHGLPTGERADAEAERAPLADRVLDDSFAVAEDARFGLRGGGREIVVEWVGGYRYAQVFAPPDLDVCAIEPMTAPVAALSTGEDLELAEPGAPVRAIFRVRVT